MYKKLDITENHLNTLTLFTNGFDQEYYIREITKILNISPRTSQLILENLEKKDVLQSTFKGKTKLFKLKNNITAKKYLLLTEQYKEILFLEKNPIIKETISEIQKDIIGIGIIFGSYAKNKEKTDSDLDILIIGEYNTAKIKETAKKYNIEINIKNYSKENFTKYLEKDYLIKEILKNHIIFKNSEEFLDIILEK